MRNKKKKRIPEGSRCSVCKEIASLVVNTKICAFCFVWPPEQKSS